MIKYTHNDWINFLLKEVELDERTVWGGREFHNGKTLSIRSYEWQ